MWQRFTERARKVVFYAQEEAGRLGENYVSTEHLLLGLIRENDSVAARILGRLGIDLGRVRAEVERQVARGDAKLGPDMQLTPRAKRVIDLAYDEAKTLNNNYIGTEHLLLGLIREGDGLAGRVLAKLGVDLDRTRDAVLQLQAGREGAEKSAPTARFSLATVDSLAALRAQHDAGTAITLQEPAVNDIADTILTQAVQSGATDIHLWPAAADTMSLQYAINGTWRTVAVLPRYLLAPMIGWFKDKAASEGAVRSTSWYGTSREPIAVDGKEYGFDVSILRYTEGERVAVALFPADD